MSLTPDGTKNDPKDPETIDEAWIISSDFPNLAKYAADAEKAAYVDDYILEACAQINQICNRKFNQQTIDQIFINQKILLGHYLSFVIDNRPLVSVNNVWLQVVDRFSPISPAYLQIDTRTGVVKILPDFTTLTSTTIPYFAQESASNLWIRYVGGFTKENVPRAVKRATSLMVDYLFASDEVEGNVQSFRTQTYSQTNARADADPLLTRIHEMLKKYILYKAC